MIQWSKCIQATPPCQLDLRWSPAPRCQWNHQTKMPQCQAFRDLKTLPNKTEVWLDMKKKRLAKHMGCKMSSTASWLQFMQSKYDVRCPVYCKVVLKKMLYRIISHCFSHYHIPSMFPWYHGQDWWICFAAKKAHLKVALKTLASHSQGYAVKFPKHQWDDQRKVQKLWKFEDLKISEAQTPGS